MRSQGLNVSDFPDLPPTHITPAAFCICLPNGNAGNSLPGWETCFTDHEGIEQLSSSGSLTIWKTDKLWHVNVHHYVPGPGPGDFTAQFDSAEAAITRVISYFKNPHDQAFCELLEAVVIEDK
ncbi:hypothetical protein [Halocynthiibacter sp.]|uniref:hypothetical protein n=1 Tax=Halocynthiibacter sp. TaxID=1979210 RepID=UPI003C59C619